MTAYELAAEVKRLRDAIKAKCLDCAGCRAQAKDCRNVCPLMGVTDLQQPRMSRKQKRTDGVQIQMKTYIVPLKPRYTQRAKEKMDE